MNSGNNITEVDLDKIEEKLTPEDIQKIQEYFNSIVSEEMENEEDDDDDKDEKMEESQEEEDMEVDEDDSSDDEN